MCWVPRSSVILTFGRPRKEGACGRLGLHNTRGLATPLYGPSRLGELENWPMHPGLEESLEAESAGNRGRIFSGFRAPEMVL